MTIISAIKTYLLTYSGLETDAPMWVNHLNKNPTEYAIVPLDGTKILANYMDGSSDREYLFAFQSVESTADELARLGNSGFFESFGDWMDAQTKAGMLPTMESNQTPEKIETLGFGYLYQQGQSETGVYQVQCKLTYYQE